MKQEIICVTSFPFLSLPHFHCPHSSSSSHFFLLEQPHADPWWISCSLILGSCQPSRSRIGTYIQPHPQTSQCPHITRLQGESTYPNTWEMINMDFHLYSFMLNLNFHWCVCFVRRHGTCSQFVNELIRVYLWCALIFVLANGACNQYCRDHCSENQIQTLWYSCFKFIHPNLSLFYHFHSSNSAK